MIVYYNHDTETFTSGPDLLEGRYSHGSALNVDKVTKSKIVVVTGGYNGNNKDSTEMLINGQWQTGSGFMCEGFFLSDSNIELADTKYPLN